MKKIGVLALQGGFEEHIASLQQLGVEACPVRLPEQLEGLNGLIIPGGESTTIMKLMKEYNLIDEVKRLISDDYPILGTCAGMVLLAKEIQEIGLSPLGAIDIEVRRNAFGRQVDSFEADLEVAVLGPSPFHAIFIRAPWIENMGNGVEVLARLSDGTPVAAREKNVITTAFHPELTADIRFHEYFMTVVDGKSKANVARV